LLSSPEAVLHSIPIRLLPALALPPRLHTFDLALIVVYLIGITLFGLRFRNSGKTGADGKADKSLKNYFLANNTAPWWAIALSIVSAETSTLTIISVPGLAFAGDFGFLQIVIGYMLGRIFIAIVFLPRYFHGELLTAYQLIGQRFGPTLHRTTAGLFLITRAAAEGVRVFAVSIVVGIAIGVNDTLAIGIISVLTLLYTFEGGMAAVIWTDVVQMLIYIVGTVIAISTLGGHVPGGWHHIHAIAAPAGKFHVFNFAFNLTQNYTFWAGALGGMFLTMASHGTEQLMVQRLLAARNLRDSRVALLSSGLVILFQFTLFLLIGAGLYVFYGLYPETFASSDRIFPTFIVREMPIGVAGLLVAAILAAAMSNLSAALNSLSSTTVVDFYMHWRPQATDRERMLLSRSSTVWWAIVLFAIAVYSVHAGGKGHVVETGLSIASVAYGSLLGVFLLGTLTKYATQTGTIIGMICGFVLNVWLWQGHFPVTIGPITIPHIAFTWYVLIGAIVTFAIGSLASLVFNKPRKAVAVAALVLLAASLPAFGKTKPKHKATKPAAVQTSPSTAPDFTAISALMNEAVATKKLPGGVVLVGHDGKIVFEQAYGNRKVDGELSINGDTAAEPMTGDTIFDMASLSKCISTATAIMQLYEAHKLDVDAPVARYLPDFAVNGKQHVTVRELLTHYSGLPPDVDLKDPWGLTAPDKAEGIRRALASSLVTTPGTHFQYSDINFITLGALVEKLSGESLDVYAQQHIFTPLGMKDTRYLPLDRACGLGADIPPYSLPAGSKPHDIVIPCDQPSSWEAVRMLPRIAPTARDTELDATVNPNFDRALRGTVHDPTTRRMGGVAGHAGVFSTAQDMSLYSQALLDKLLHNTGPFPLKQSTLRLMTEPQQPATARADATILTPSGGTTKGVATRGFGWDLNTAYSKPRGGIFPITTAGNPGSFGHTGFTGTTLWIDPTSDSYVILLANAVHPRGNPPITTLRAQVATAAALALRLEGTPTLPVLTGIDVLEATHFRALADIAAHHNGHLRIGLLTNQSGINSQRRRTIDILHTDAHKAIPGLTLTTLFSPEHGVFGAKDSTNIGDEIDPTTHLHVLSLYGPKPEDKRPKDEDLKKLDAVVIDLQDVGVRFYTYETAVGYFLEAAAQNHIEVIVLDRPNVIGGEKVQGPVSDVGHESYTGYMPLPVRHGMTMGELARYFNGEHRIVSPLSPNVAVPINAQLTVVPMQNWSRSDYFDQTGLPWVNPSPNLRNVAASTLYPGVAFLEATGPSVGRGSDAPFEQFGGGATPKSKTTPAKPAWFNGTDVATYLNGRHIPGVTFTATTFPVAEDTNHYPGYGQTIEGVRITITDRNLLDSPEMGIEILSALHHLYPDPAQFDLAKAGRLIVNVNTMQDLVNNEDPRTIAASWSDDIKAYLQRREQYLLYK
jgi:SSS family transporter